MKHEIFFREHAVFTGAEFAAYLAKTGDYGARGQESILGYYLKTGKIQRIKRNLYAVHDGHSAGKRDGYIDPYLIAGKLTKDAVLSHHTALQFHGHAYSVHNEFVYTSTRPIPVLTFQSHTFKGTSIPVALHRNGKEEFGVQFQDRAGVGIKVTSLERAMVDTLDRPKLSGSWEEIWRSLESVEFFDLESIVLYVTLLDNATTAAKVGFFLEQHRDTLMVEDRHLAQLSALCPAMPHYLDRNRRDTNRYVPHWQLMVPEEILNRSWEELH